MYSKIFPRFAQPKISFSIPFLLLYFCVDANCVWHSFSFEKSTWSSVAKRGSLLINVKTLSSAVAMRRTSAKTSSEHLTPTTAGRLIFGELQIEHGCINCWFVMTSNTTQMRINLRKIVTTNTSWNLEREKGHECYKEEELFLNCEKVHLSFKDI